MNNNFWSTELKENTALPILTEDEEQQALFRWIAFAAGRYPKLKLCIHIPNEGKRSAANGAKLKRMGLRPGAPDVFLPVSNGKYNNLFIEMKRTKGGKVSAAQKRFIEDLNKYGNLAVVCNGWEEAVKVICDYLGIKNPVSMW